MASVTMATMDQPLRYRQTGLAGRYAGGAVAVAGLWLAGLAGQAGGMAEALALLALGGVLAVAGLLRWLWREELALDTVHGRYALRQGYPWRARRAAGSIGELAVVCRAVVDDINFVSYAVTLQPRDGAGEPFLLGLHLEREAALRQARETALKLELPLRLQGVDLIETE